MRWNIAINGARLPDHGKLGDAMLSILKARPRR